MRISICIPVLGRPRLLFEALCSILMQGFDDVEVVIQDGDPSHAITEDPQVAQLIGMLGSRAKYRAELDGGITQATNLCLKQATGDILHYMCGDDLLCPGALVAVHEAFSRERFGGPYWVYGQTISAHESGRTQGVDPEAAVTLEEMLAHNRIGAPAVFWNRAMLEMTGPFDTRYRYAADYELWLRFWRQREPEYVPQTLGLFRHHENQTTVVHGREIEREAFTIGQRHRALGDMIARARRAQALRRFYQDDFPLSVN